MPIDVSRPRVRAYAPGRTELAGNHTDHQGGKAIAATVDCGTTMVLQACDSNTACVDSAGFGTYSVDVASCEPVEAERFTTAALVRGVIAGLRGEGAEIGGFYASVRSDVAAGSGLSSSAAFELALAKGLAVLFADDGLDPHVLARIAQAAERTWFGKPCGLLDQLSIALGGVNLLDFGTAACGRDGSGNGNGDCAATPLPCDFEGAGYVLCLIDTHCDHSRYAHEYAQVALDMNAVASYLGARRLSGVSQEAMLVRLGDIRRDLGDGPALRGLHYYREMALVQQRARALEAGDIAAFLSATRQSGASSAQYLQNVSTGDRLSQPAMVALALADHLLDGRGAARIHGGGFGGTVQAFVPVDTIDSFARGIDSCLGAGSCRRYRIVSEGATAAWER